MECSVHPFNTLEDYIFADAIAFYNGKWMLCKHKNRTTWETQGGHIEPGETPLEAARRELYEESGAIDFDLEPVCDYHLDCHLDGVHIQGNSQVFLAKVRELGPIPDGSEMERVRLFDSLPDNLTYAELTYAILPLVLEKLPQMQ